MALKPAKTLKNPNLTALDFEFARHDSALCNMPGLFRHFTETMRRKFTEEELSLKLSYVHGLSVKDAEKESTALAAKTKIRETLTPREAQELDDALLTLKEKRERSITIEVTGPLLNGFDLMVLQGIIAMSALQGAAIIGEGRTPDERAHRKHYAADTSSENQLETLQYINFSTSELMSVIGLSGSGAHRKRVDVAIKALAGVMLFIFPTFADKHWTRYLLLSGVQSTNHNGKWHQTTVALNPRLTQIVVGAERHYTHIDLDEARVLGNDYAARILHQRLCAWIDHGISRDVGYEKLLSYLFWDDKTGKKMEHEFEKDVEYASMTTEERRDLKIDIMVNAMNNLERLPGWSVIPCDELPFVLPKNATPEEEMRASEAHQQEIRAAKIRSSKNPLNTVVRVHRGKLNVFSYAEENPKAAPRLTSA